MWTLLYIMMGVAACMVWADRGWQRGGNTLRLFIVQLGANALWTWIFFVWHMGAMAMAEILLLWALIVWTIMSFWRVRKVAGALLIPYLLWVSFASVLTYFMWQGNPQIL